MAVFKSFVMALCALGMLLSIAADNEAWADEQIAAAADAAPPAEPPKIDTGDHAWMLVSSALVLMMTAPGLALFYCGLVRKKNVLGVMMQCFFLMGLLTVVWALWGYSLSFGGDNGAKGFNPYVGNTDYLFMRGCTPYIPEKDIVDETKKGADGKPLVIGPAGTIYYPLVGTIPRLTHMVYQGMFFIITPALICGAFAERMKFSTLVVFMILWGTLIYCPLAHWVWGGGLLAYDFNTGTKFNGAWAGALDFAGGTVVHISSGVSALVCALVMGRRLGFGHEPMPPHNLTYTVIGAALLWVGWFGFNGGSALAANGQAASAFVATHFAAAAAALAWAGMEWIMRGKPTVLGACSGAVAGLVCITPASGFVQPMPALIMGVAAGVVCFLACTWLKGMFKYDDALDAFGVHGIGGTLGALLTGVFATQAVAVAGTQVPLGQLEGGPILQAQVVAAGVTWAYAAVGTFIILKVLDVVMGLRVSQQDEIQGLDYSQHGEEGYIFI